MIGRRYLAATLLDLCEADQQTLVDASRPVLASPCCRSCRLSLLRLTSERSVAACSGTDRRALTRTAY